jgi:hypothetical protein
MSEPVTTNVAVAVLFVELGSFGEPVLPLSGDEPGAVGVPETVQVIAAPGATVEGGVGAHDVVKPAGRPVTAHVALVAAMAGAAAFEQVKEPEYGTPTEALVGRPERLMLMSEPDTATAWVAVLLPPFASFVAPVATETVDDPVAVGVPETAHEMLAPAATVAGGVGVHAPTVTPGGRPEMAQVALVAPAVAAVLLVHLKVPL